MARRVLALHGYSQSSSVFYKKTGALRRKLRKKGIDIVYTQAPFELDASQLHGTPPEGESLYGWWTFDETNYYGVEESIEFVSKVIETEGPFEGIIGFSQGACLLSLICAKHSVLSLAGFDSLKYVVLVSAFIPKCSNIQNSCTYFKKEELIYPIKLGGNTSTGDQWLYEIKKGDINKGSKINKLWAREKIDRIMFFALATIQFCVFVNVYCN